MLLRTKADELFAAVNALDGFRVRRILPSDLLTASQSSHRNMYLHINQLVTGTYVQVISIIVMILYLPITSLSNL